MGLYTGFDLHSSNTYLGIIDEDGKRVFRRKLQKSDVSKSLPPKLWMLEGHYPSMDPLK